jgi:lipoprotein-releasing system permease protein
MFNPVEIFVGLRYLRAKRRTKFVSFITLISLIGIALGVAALIVILSVMNGFETELRDRLLSMTAHGYITGTDRRVDDWQDVHKQIADADNIVAAAPLIQVEGMIRTGRALKGVILNGVEPDLEQAVSGKTINFLEGDLSVLAAGERSIVLGRSLVMDLSVRMGEGVVLLVPRPDGKGGLEPVLERFILRGVFAAGVQEHDQTLGLIHIEDAARITGLASAVTSIRFLADDVLIAPLVASSLVAQLGDGYVSSDWTIENASYFRAIGIEKMMMSLILSLIIGVAAFNIVASLVMVVTDKTTDIAILRTLGMGPGGVVRGFFIQGAVIGWLGVIVGVLSGVLLALNVPTIVPAVERFFGFEVMPSDVYYVTKIPSVLEYQDVAIIGFAAFILTSFATLYPARRAAKVNPSIALRYE